jgi:hypothetical protein
MPPALMPAVPATALALSVVVAVGVLAVVAITWRLRAAPRTAGLHPFQTDADLVEAIRAFLLDSGRPDVAARYLGNCQAATWPADIGRYCSRVRPRPDGSVVVTIHRAFDGGTLDAVLFRRVARSWTAQGR